jgi:hypothetical protein
VLSEVYEGFLARTKGYEFRSGTTGMVMERRRGSVERLG